jgi:uncharacterized protein DUF4339
MNITIHRDGQNYGPYSVPDVRQHLASGSLTLTDLAFIEGASEWTTLGQVPGIATNTPPPPPSRILSGALPEQESPTTNFSNLKPYYQERFKKIEESNEQYQAKWNWAAFFFTWIWAYTKGLNKNATLFLLLCFVAAGAFGAPLGVVMIYYGIRGNWLYYNKVKYNKDLWF